MQTRFTLWFIFITVMLDAAGFGIMMPILPSLIEEVSSGDFADHARIGGYLMFAFGLTQFLFGPFIGNLSDAYGRRPVLLVSLFGMIVDYVIMALAGSIAWLMFGRILGGVTSATHATAFAVAADISDQDDKAANFGLIGAAFGIGFILGPALGGVLSLIGPRAPFWGAAGLAAVNLCFGYFVFKETLGKKERRPFQWYRANPIGSIFVLSSKPSLWAFVGLYFFFYFSYSVFPAIWAFYVEYRFDFEPWMTATTLVIFGIGVAISQGVMIRPAMRLWGARKISNFGIFFGIWIFLGFAFVMDWRLLMILLVIAALADMTGPALQDLVTRLVSASEQGELQGILASVSSLTMILGTIIFSQSFAYFTEPESKWHFDGVPFVICAFSMFLAWLIFNYKTHQKTVKTALDGDQDEREQG